MLDPASFLEFRIRLAEQAITPAVVLGTVPKVADWRDDRIGSALRGANPTVLARMLGEAVERACRASDSAFRRVNIEILGNADRYLHAHVWPRYGWEDSQLIVRPVWLYPAKKWRDPNTLLGPQHSALRAAIATELLASR